MWTTRAARPGRRPSCMPNPGSPLLPSWLSPRFLSSCSKESTDHYEGARAKVAAFINAPRPEEVVFTRNATEGGHASCPALCPQPSHCTSECRPAGGLVLPLLTSPAGSAAGSSSAARGAAPQARVQCGASLLRMRRVACSPATATQHQAVAQPGDALRRLMAYPARLRFGLQG